MYSDGRKFIKYFRILILIFTINLYQHGLVVASFERNLEMSLSDAGQTVEIIICELKKKKDELRGTADNLPPQEFPNHGRDKNI